MAVCVVHLIISWDSATVLQNEDDDGKDDEAQLDPFTTHKLSSLISSHKLDPLSEEMTDYNIWKQSDLFNSLFALSLPVQLQIFHVKWQVKNIYLLSLKNWVHRTILMNMYLQK